jgi:hypothetical protein
MATVRRPAGRLFDSLAGASNRMRGFPAQGSAAAVRTRRIRQRHNQHIFNKVEQA